MIALLNAAVLTGTGFHTVDEVSLTDAVKLVETDGFVSYVGHPGTAEILSTLFGVQVPVSREMYAQGEGDVALAFKLNGRPEPGRELSRAEVEEIGFTFWRIQRLSVAAVAEMFRDDTEGDDESDTVTSSAGAAWREGDDL